MISEKGERAQTKKKKKALFEKRSTQRRRRVREERREKRKKKKEREKPSRPRIELDGTMYVSESMNVIVIQFYFNFFFVY